MDARANDVLVTPAGMAHLFEAVGDGVLLEWWDCAYAAWHYAPYRARVDARAAEMQRREEAAPAPARA